MRAPDEFPAAPPADHAARLTQPQRLEALSASALLDSLPEESFDRIVRLATHIAGAPVGLFSLVTPERQFFKAAAGLEAVLDGRRETPLGSSFCQYVVSLDRPLAVTDAREHPLLAENGATRDLGVVAYMGVPIHATGGLALGSLCAIDSQPRVWSAQQLDLLRDLAAILEAEIALRQAARDRQLILSEMHHRTKNLFAVVASIVRLSRRAHEDDSAAMAAEIEQRLEALSVAHQLILPAITPGSVARAEVRLVDLVSTLLAPYGRRGAAPAITGPEVMLGSAATTNLALALHEMATNSAKYGALGHAGPGAHDLSVGWHHADGHLLIDWIDAGPVGGGAAQAACPDADDADTEGGFGSQLIETTIVWQLDGHVSEVPGATGFSLRLTIPEGSLAG